MIAAVENHQETQCKVNLSTVGSGERISVIQFSIFLFKLMIMFWGG